MESPRRKSTATRRKEIARATLGIIGSRGLTKLTTTNIALEVGLTSGALFRHFESREEILGEAVEIGLTEIGKTFPDDEEDPVERLWMLARNRVLLLSKEPGLAFLLGSDQAFLALPEEAVRRLDEMVRRTRIFLLACLRDGAAMGSFRSDIESELLLVPVMGTIHALIGSAGVRGRPESGNEERIERVLGALMRWLAPPREEHGSE